MSHLVEGGLSGKYARDMYQLRDLFDKMWKLWDLKEYVVISLNRGRFYPLLV